MSFGSTAYESFVRIHRESGKRPRPSWEDLSHVGRMAWEAAAQAVALAVLPNSYNFDPRDDEDDDGDEDEYVGEDLSIDDQPTEDTASPGQLQSSSIDEVN